MTELTINQLALYMGARFSVTDTVPKQKPRRGSNKHQPVFILNIGLLDLIQSGSVMGQLMLRPLSDITDAEALQILEMRTGRTDLKDLQVLVNKQDPDFYIIFALNDEGAVDTCHYMLSPRQTYTPEEVLFYLTNHFDIFGWIESKHALPQLINS